MRAKRAPRRRPRKVGIALGAGGARGLAHVGVLRALTEAHVPIDAIVGSSIGALVGAIFAAGQLENFERHVKSLDWTEVLRMFDPVWPRAGLLSGDRSVERLAGMLGDWRIEDLAVPFAAVAVDLVSGEEVVIREGRVLDALRASMSIPGIFVPHRKGRQVLVDGALRNPVPVSVLDALGADAPDVRLAVNLHGTPVRELSPLSARAARRPRIGARMADMLDRRLRRGPRQRAPATADPDGGADAAAPNVFEVLTASMTVIEYELARHRLANEPVDLVLTPDVHAIRSFEFHKARQAIHAGSVEAEARLSEIDAILRRRPRRRPRGAGGRGTGRRPYWSGGKP